MRRSGVHGRERFFLGVLSLFQAHKGSAVTPGKTDFEGKNVKIGKKKSKIRPTTHIRIPLLLQTIPNTSCGGCSGPVTVAKKHGEGTNETNLMTKKGKIENKTKNLTRSPEKKGVSFCIWFMFVDFQCCG
mmetsp:Transcript_75859/g.123191  ORF Transcript_75859/g.123191 Transcript_75859/m.123191 type:complete len:130 (+) Transcript_75859:249-638(+)